MKPNARRGCAGRGRPVLIALLALLCPGLLASSCSSSRRVETADYVLEYERRDGGERVGRTAWRYAYTVTLTPTRSGAGNVYATVTSTTPTTVVTQGDLYFGDVERGVTATSQRPLVIEQDRSVPFDPQRLVFDVDPIEQAPYDFTALEAEIEAFLAATPGAAGANVILVEREDGVIYKRSFGAFTPDRVSFIASASKMIAAGVLLALDDRGLLDVDAPVSDATGWDPEDNPSITPAQLVSNTSGLPGLAPLFIPHICQYLVTGTLTDCGEEIFTTPENDPMPGDPPDAVRAIPPDTAFRYGGGQWQVAGGVAELASGKTWRQLIDELYVEPCGLEAFGFSNPFTAFPGTSVAGYPVGFDGDLSKVPVTDNPNLEGGAYTTSGDYGKLLLMHLRDGLCGENEVMSAAAVDTLHTDRLLEVLGPDVVTGFGGLDGYGYGWWHDRSTPAVLLDPGAWGATAWLDTDRKYAGFILVEDSSAGTPLYARIRGLAEAAVDAAR